MGTSFAAYASQFLNRQHNPESSLSSSQPLFFSFTTDNGSRAGLVTEDEGDDIDDPHLRESSDIYRRDNHVQDIDDDDPYLRLDEDEHKRDSRYGTESIPLVASPSLSQSPDSPRGWLAHQSSPPTISRRPSSSSSDSGPPPGFFNSSAQPPPPPRAHISLSMTESLLPRDGHVRPIDVFSLPDPRHVPRGRRKYNDYPWTAVWCTGLTLCFISSVLVLFLTHKPSDHPPAVLPYTTLLHTVPLLTILTFLSALAAYIHIFLLRVFVRPVMVATSVFIPATLFISALWAFIGSFMWEAGQEPTWGETVGLRLFAIIPFVLSLITARRLVNLPRDIHTTSSTLTLSTQLLLTNPYLLALSPVILLAALVLSIPFLTLVFRLLLVGYFPNRQGHDQYWHVKGWAHWAIFGTVAIWLWSWGIARGILRTTCAGVIGAWYFAQPDLPPPPPSSTHTIHAALTRATSPSFGTIVLSALLLTSIRLLALFTTSLRVLPSYIPLIMRPWLQPIFIGATMAVGMLEGVTTSLSKYALVYTGLTGDPFFVSARRARALTAVVENSSAGKFKRRFKSEPPLAMLTISPLTLTFPFALITYLFVAHTLSAPDQALGAAVLAGGVTALVGLFCVGLVKDTADTLYICYCIDKDVGEKRRVEVFSAFEYENRRLQPSQRPALPSRAQSSQSPRTERPQQAHGPPSRSPRDVPLQQPQQQQVFIDPDPFEVDESDAEHAAPLLRSPDTVRPYLAESDDLEAGAKSSQLLPGSDLF